MVKHMIIWKLKDEIVDKLAAANNIKTALEGLQGKIDGLIKMSIFTDKLDGSSGDVMMDSLFKDEKSLKDYQAHPLHQEIANLTVRPNVQTRLSFDFEI